MTMQRLTRDEYALMLAHTASLRSEDPYVRVGAIAMTSDGRVIASGYNGLYAGKQVLPTFWEDREARRKFIIHAEINVCSLIRRGDAHTLAVTLSPCAACANAIAATGFKRVVYSSVYDRDTSGLTLLRDYGIELVYVPSEHIIQLIRDNINDDTCNRR